MKIISQPDVTVYTFDELSETAKAKALEKESESQGEFWEGTYQYDDFEAIANILGIEFARKPVKLMNGSTRYDPAIYYSGFWSQGDGASFEGTYAYKCGCRKAIRSYAPVDGELHRIADDLFALQKAHFYRLKAKIETRGNYSHSGTMQVDVYDDPETGAALPDDEMTQLMRDFADWMYRQLEADYEWATGEEACKDSIEANELEFLEDGTVWN